MWRPRRASARSTCSCTRCDSTLVCDSPRSTSRVLSSRAARSSGPTVSPVAVSTAASRTSGDVFVGAGSPRIAQRQVGMRRDLAALGQRSAQQRHHACAKHRSAQLRGERVDPCERANRLRPGRRALALTPPGRPGSRAPGAAARVWRAVPGTNARRAVWRLAGRGSLRSGPARCRDRVPQPTKSLARHGRGSGHHTCGLVKVVGGSPAGSRAPSAGARASPRASTRRCDRRCRRRSARTRFRASAARSRRSSPRCRARRVRSSPCAGQEAHAHAGDDALRQARDVGPGRGQLGDQRARLGRQHAVDVVFDHVQAAACTDCGRPPASAGGIEMPVGLCSTGCIAMVRAPVLLRDALERVGPQAVGVHRHGDRRRCPAGARLRAGRRTSSSSTSTVSPGASRPARAATSAAARRP